MFYFQMPFSSQEHYTLPAGVYMPVVVYENEPSSIVAYALNSFDYKRALEDMIAKRSQTNDQSPSPVHKRKNTEKSNSESDSGLLSFLRNKEQKSEPGSPAMNAALVELR